MSVSSSTSSSSLLIDDVPLRQPSRSDTSSVSCDDNSQCDVLLQDVLDAADVATNEDAADNGNEEDDDDISVDIESAAYNDFDNMTFKHVILTEQATNVCNKIKGECQFSKILQIGSTPVLKIKLQPLQAFCKNNGLANIRKKTKKDLLDKIVYAIENPQTLAEELSAELKKKENPKAPRPQLKTTNRKRYINVMFHDDIRPKLLTRGEVLNRRTGLDEGKKTDQDLFQLIADEYNDRSKDCYNGDEVPDAKFRKDASSFSPITWQKAKEVYKSLSNEYEKLRADWKKSGNHSSLEQLEIEGADLGHYEQDPDDETKYVKKFESFSKTNRAMMYLHTLVYRFKGFFDKFVANLDKGVYRDSEGFLGCSENSSSDGYMSQSTAYRRRAQAKIDQEKREKENRYYESVFQRNQIITSAVAQEMKMKELQYEKDRLQLQFMKSDRKRTLKETFVESIRKNGNDLATAKSLAKERIQTFKKKKEKHNIENNNPENEGTNLQILIDTMFESEDTEPDSQESLLQELYDLEN